MMRPSYLIFHYILFLCTLFHSSPATTTNERQALVDFYNALNGKEWVNNENWLSEGDPCIPSAQWFGLYGRDFLPCVGSPEVIRFEDNNLQGSLPDIFDSFLNISAIFLQDEGEVRGTIPDSLFLPPALQTVELSRLSIEGSIPDSLGEATNLEELVIVGRSKVVIGPTLTGPIPHSIGNCTKLFRLQLQYMFLDPVFPDSMAALTQMTTFAVSDSVTSTLGFAELPNWICGWTNLSYLDLAQTFRNGSLPNCLSRLTSLTTLYLNGNELSGTLPSDIGNLTDLRFFSAAGNMMSGNLPSGLSNILELVVLEFSDNSFTGTLPTEWGRLERLETLTAGVNQLSGPLPSEYSHLTRLRVLELVESGLNGTLPPEYCALQQLNQLWLKGNEFSGTIPPCYFSDFPELYLVYMADNQLSGSVPPISLPDVTLVSLSGNFLEGSLPELKSSSILTDIYVFNNTLSGSIPESWLESQLRVLSLAHNALSGSLRYPETARVLEVASNSFSGTVPTTMCDVRQVDVRDNDELSCPLPTCCNYDESCSLRSAVTHCCSVECVTTEESGTGWTFVVGGAVAGIVIFVLLFLVLMDRNFRARRSRAQYEEVPEVDDAFPDSPLPLPGPVLPVPPELASLRAYGSGTAGWGDDVSGKVLKDPSRIGHASSVVFEATHMGEHVAARMFDMNDAESMGALQKEASLLYKVRHPHVCTYFGISLEPSVKRAWVLMELYDMSLDGILYNPDFWSKFNLFHRIVIACHLARAVAFLHQSTPAIIHRSIKPSNVLLNLSPLHVVLGNFRQAVEEGSKGVAVPIREMKYIAPEVTLGGEYSKLSDVFALGATLLELFEEGSGANQDYGLGSVPSSILSSLRCCISQASQRPTAEQVQQIFEEVKLKEEALSSSRTAAAPSVEVPPGILTLLKSTSTTW